MVPPSVSLIGHIFSLLKVFVMCFIVLLGDPSAVLFKFSWAFLKMGNFFFFLYHIRENWKIARYNQRRNMKTEVTEPCI